MSLVTEAQWAERDHVGNSGAVERAGRGICLDVRAGFRETLRTSRMRGWQEGMLKADTETSGEREPISPKDLLGQAQSFASAFHNLIASVSPRKGQSSSPQPLGH